MASSLTEFTKFKELPMEIHLMILDLNNNLQLQYDDKPPPLLLALGRKPDENLALLTNSERNLKDLYGEAQRIYKDINLRVDHTNQNAVKALSLEKLRKFRHVMFVSNSLHE
jgi:hypothetical protein